MNGPNINLRIAIRHALVDAVCETFESGFKVLAKERDNHMSEEAFFIIAYAIQQYIDNITFPDYDDIIDNTIKMYGLESGGN